MFKQIKRKKKGMAKIQRRSYSVRHESGRSRLYNHLIASVHAEIIMPHLDVGFERNLFLAALRNLSDEENQVCCDDFSCGMKKVISVISAKHSSDNDILNEKFAIFSREFNELIKHTHLSSSQTFDFSDHKCEERSSAALKLASDMVTAIVSGGLAIHH
ncbi:MAG: hypothetical protein ACI808_000221 [Paraglaciecola sp.]